MDDIESLARSIKDTADRGRCGMAAQQMAEMTFLIGARNLQEAGIDIWKHASNDIYRCFTRAHHTSIDAARAFDW